MSLLKTSLIFLVRIKLERHIIGIVNGKRYPALHLYEYIDPIFSERQRLKYKPLPIPNVARGISVPLIVPFVIISFCWIIYAAIPLQSKNIGCAKTVHSAQNNCGQK